MGYYKKWYDRTSPYFFRSSCGYLETNCDYCGKLFTKEEEELNRYEKENDVILCIHCGGENPIDKRIRERFLSHGKARYTLVPCYSVGFEIEFFIPQKSNDKKYIRMVNDPVKDYFGFDGETPAIKEYRSPVYYGETKEQTILTLIYELKAAVREIKNLGGELIPWKFYKGRLLTFGIHLSFGLDFLTDADFKEFLYNGKFKKSVPFSFICSFIKPVDEFRLHEERMEHRGFRSTNKSIPIIINVLKENIK